MEYINWFDCDSAKKSKISLSSVEQEEYTTIIGWEEGEDVKHKCLINENVTRADPSPLIPMAHNRQELLFTTNTGK